MDRTHMSVHTHKRAERVCVTDHRGTSLLNYLVFAQPQTGLRIRKMFMKDDTGAITNLIIRPNDLPALLKTVIDFFNSHNSCECVLQLSPASAGNFSRAQIIKSRQKAFGC